MRVEVSKVGSKERYVTDCEEIGLESLEEKFAPNVKESVLDEWLENLNVSAEAKVILTKIKNTMVRIGNTLLKIGHCIIETIIYFVKKFPATAVGATVGLCIGLLISSIPIVGWVLGSILTPLLTALGLGLGYMADIRAIDLKVSVENHIDEVFGGLKGVPVGGK